MTKRVAMACALLSVVVSARAQNAPQASTQAAAAAQSGAANTAPAESQTVDLSRIDPAKVANIRILQELRGDKRNAVQVMDTMLNSIRPLMSKSLPPGEYRDKLIDLFMQRIRTMDLAQQILDAAIPIYDKYLSDDDIKGLIQFYQTPVGKKLTSVTPMMTAELQSVGEKRGQDAGRQAMLQVLAEHPDVAKALEDTSNATKPQ